MRTLEIVNQLGQVVESISSNFGGAITIDLNNSPQGIYFVIEKNAFKSYVSKVIISR